MSNFEFRFPKNKHNVPKFRQQKVLSGKITTCGCAGRGIFLVFKIIFPFPIFLGGVAMSNKGKVYTRKLMAQILDLSEKRVKQLTEEGITPYALT